MEIPGYLISAIVGFATALLALPFQTLAANNRAMKTLTGVFNDTINRLRDDVKELNDKIEEMKPFRCERMSCKQRIPPKFNNSNEPEE